MVVDVDHRFSQSLTVPGTIRNSGWGSGNAMLRN